MFDSLGGGGGVVVVTGIAAVVAGAGCAVTVVTDSSDKSVNQLQCKLFFLT